MKFILALLITALSLTKNAATEEFESWALRYSKVYGSQKEKERRKQIWEDNVQYIAEINGAGLTWTADINKFGDLTAREFREKILMPNVNAIPSLGLKKGKHLTSKAGDGQVPEYFDWRLSEKGVVTSVKDQGFVGTCWTFSTIGNIEGAWALKNNATAESLSTEFLVDCDGTVDEELNHADCSIFGGWPYLAFEYIISRGGIPSESDYPYCSGSGSCYPCMEGPVSLCGLPPYSCDRDRTKLCKQWSDYKAKISDWFQVAESEEAVTQSLYKTGPLSVLLDASSLQFYKSGIFAPRSCSTTDLNHAVLLVGYNSSGSTSYYSVKNSWGPEWGDNGYFNIIRSVGETGPGTCGIQSFVTSSIV